MSNNVNGLAKRWEERFPGIDARVVESWARLGLVSKLIERFQRQALQPFGLLLSDYQVLAAISTSGNPGGMLPSELCDSLYQTPAGMTKTLDRLQKMRTIRRRPDARDRRATRVTLTARGGELATTVCLTELEWQQEIFESLKISELRTLDDLLDRVSHALSTKISEL